MNLTDIKEIILKNKFYDDNGEINPNGVVYSNCHYTIKYTIHSNTYYYLDRIFQSQLYCSVLAAELFKSLPKTEKTLFVGHGQHASQIFYFLEILFKEALLKDNRFVFLHRVEDRTELADNENMQFSSEVKLSRFKNIVIILPIATTCNSLPEIERQLYQLFEKEKRSLREKFNEAFKSQKTDQGGNDKSKRAIKSKRDRALAEYMKNFEKLPIDHNIYALFLICDPLKEIVAREKGQDGFYPVTNQLYFDSNWQAVSDSFTIRYRQADMRDGHDPNWTVNPAIHLPAHLELAYKCKMCFPDNYEDELYHFPLNEHYKTPNKHLTYETDYRELPTKSLLQHYNNLEKITTDPTKYVELLKKSHLFGALKFTRSDYLNFIEGDIFYEINKDDILAHLNDDFVKKIDEKVKHIYVVTYGVNRQSTFLEDLSTKIKSGKPHFEDVHILRYNEETNYIENFWHSLRGVNEDPETLLIYYEDVISTGRTLTTLLRRLNFLDISFDYIITLVDRTTINTKRTIIKSFKKEGDPKERFIPFISLYVPVINPLNYKNPRLEEINKLHQILKLTHLDFLKLEIERKIANSTPRSLSELKSIKQSFNLSTYKYIYDDKLLLLYIKHKLHIRVNTDPQLHIEELVQLLKTDPVIVSRINSPVFASGNNINSEQHLKVTLLLCLCEYPFHYFLPIQKFVFESFLQIVGKSDFNSEDFYKLMDVSIIVNSNYIASIDFFDRLRNFIKICTPNDIERVIKNVCYLIKRYVGTDLNRCFRLERLLMEEAVFPFGYDILKNLNPYKTDEEDEKTDQFNKIKDLSNDAYWLIYRLIKAENLNVLNSLLNDFPVENMNISERINTRKFFKDFIDLSLFKLAGIPEHEIESSIESVKACLERIEQFKVTSDLNFEEQLKSLLHALKNIFPSKLDIDYHFCIRYSNENNSSDKRYVDNVYTVSSDNHFKKNKTNISKKGLVHHFLEGEIKSGLVQTFLPLYRNGTGKFQTFEGCLKSAGNNNTPPKDEFHQLVIEDAATFTKGQGDNLIETATCDYFNTANVLLAFRLTKHYFDETKSPFYFRNKLPKKSLEGRAVLLLFSQCKVVSPMVFIFIELFRLLFLIKEDLLDYLDLQFRNSAFQQVLLDAEESKLVKDLNHNIAGYSENIIDIMTKDAVDYQTKVKFLKKLLAAITSQQFARDKDYKFIEQKFTVDYFKEELKMWAGKLIMNIELPIFESKMFIAEQDDLRNSKPLLITSYFWDAILPEIIVNIKKYNADILSEIRRNGDAKVRGKKIEPEDLLNIQVRIIAEKDGSRKLEIVFSNLVRVNNSKEIKTLKEGGGLLTHKSTLIRRRLGNLEPDIKKDNRFDKIIKVFETKITLKIFDNENCL